MVSGSATLNASPDEVWTALNDPAVLVRTLPGCQRLEAIGENTYAMTLSAGVASIKGLYAGQVRLADPKPPDSFVLKASGAGAPGTVSADVLVTLADAANGTTTLTYEADAVIGGMIGGVGQRMLGGVAKRTAAEFFSAVNEVLAHAVPDVPPTDVDSAQVGAGLGALATKTALRPGVFEAPQRAETNAGDFMRGALVGGTAALCGVIVGGWLTGRRRRV